MQYKYCLLILISLFTGCVYFTKTEPDGNVNRRVFQASYDDTWNAVILSLGDIPLEKVDKSNGFIKTAWIKGKSEKETSGLLFVRSWKERSRLLINVTSISAIDKNAEVTITLHAEEKAPGGIQGSMWQRKATDGSFENSLIEKIEQFLTY